MPNPFPSEKDRARTRAREILRTLDPGYRHLASQDLVARCQSLPTWEAATRVLLFWPLSSEPDLTPLIVDALNTGREVWLPRFHTGDGIYLPARVLNLDADLESGPHGARQPRAGLPGLGESRLDFIAVPGLAFTGDGHRLGRGGGFYDRLLRRIEGPTFGMGFDVQLVPHLPIDPHDVVLDCILTPSRCIRAGNGSV